MAALTRAVRRGDAEEVERLLLAPGTEIDALDERRSTALSIACGNNDAYLINKLLDAGAAINGTGENENSPLQVAAAYCSEEAVGLLLERGADKDAINRGRTALTNAISSSGSYDSTAAKRLLLAGADIHLYRTRAPIHAAAQLESPEFLEALIAMGADVNAPAHDCYKYTHIIGGLTPLHYAADCLRFDNVNFLLQSGANVNALDRYQRTPLHCAARNVVLIIKRTLCQKQKQRQSDIIAALIQAGAEVLWKDVHGRTPLQESRRACSDYLTGSDAEEWLGPCNHETCNFAYRNYYNLVAAGDRNWDCVPTNFPGLEQALLPVWREAPEELPELFKRLTQEVKERIQLGLRVLHGRVPKELHMLVLAMAVMVEKPCAPSYLIDPKYFMMPAYFI